jgi:DNA polymerase-3 subunit delta
VAKQVKDTSSYQQLKQDIRDKQPKRLYIFHGEETFLLHHYLDQLRRLLLDEVTEAFNSHRLNSETFDIRTLADAVEGLPVMAEHTYVQVDDIDLFKRSEDEREKIIDLISDIPDYCTLVFTYETTPWKPDKRLKKLWGALEKYAAVVDFQKQEPRELIPWISRHFASKGKRISNDLCSYLIDITGGTMIALSGEIEKISAYSGAEHIVKADIDAVTEPVMDAVVFQMTDQMGQGQYAAALTKLHQLLKMQQEPILILGAIGSQFRRIATARTLMDHGKGTSDLMKLCGLSNYPAQKTMDTARRFSAGFCATASELILETDHHMKTSFDSQERLLELLVLRLAQEARRG